MVPWRPIGFILALVALGAGVRAVRLRRMKPTPGPAPVMARGAIEMAGPDGERYWVVLRPEVGSYKVTSQKSAFPSGWSVEVALGPEARPGAFSVEVQGTGILGFKTWRNYGDFGELYAVQGHVVRYHPTVPETATVIGSVGR